MDQTGTLVVQVTTSRAELPVDGATVVVAVPATEGKYHLSALLITDESGRAGPVTLAIPVTGDGQAPGGPTPFAAYCLWVEHPEFEVVYVKDLQVFAGVESVQQIDLIPLAQPVWSGGNASEQIDVTPQPL